LGWDGVWLKATKPDESEAEGVGGLPSKGVNPVPFEVDDLIGVAEAFPFKSARILVAHSRILGFGW
jgi:hypothetical protein